MRGALHRPGNSGSKQLAAIDQLLIAGIKLGPAKKRDAIKKILELVLDGPVRIVGGALRSCGRPLNARVSQRAFRTEQRVPGKRVQSEDRLPCRGRRRTMTICLNWLGPNQ